MRPVETIAGAGGDLIKCTADTVLVAFALEAGSGSDSEALITQARRAAQCACDLSTQLHNKLLYQDVYSSSHLNLKCGVAAGRFSILQLGGVYQSFQHLATGLAVSEVCLSLAHLSFFFFSFCIPEL